LPERLNDFQRQSNFIDNRIFIIYVTILTGESIYPKSLVKKTFAKCLIPLKFKQVSKNAEIKKERKKLFFKGGACRNKLTH